MRSNTFCAERGRHDHADDTFHQHPAKGQDDASDEGHRRGDGLTEATPGPAGDHAGTDAGREGDAGEDRHAEVASGLLQSERNLAEFLQVIETPGQRHAEGDSQKEGGHEPACDDGRRRGISL